MSLKNVCDHSTLLLRRNNIVNLYWNNVNCYSRRSERGSNGPYKVVKSENKAPQETHNLHLVNSTNWELLAPRGYPFYLPGSVGPAWQNTQTAVPAVNKSLLNPDLLNPQNNDGNKNSKSKFRFSCHIQECPVLLRKGVSELFPGRDLLRSDLTVVTILQRPNAKRLRNNRELETEKLAKSFVLTAQEICLSLEMLGYWADFINPFSGRPYLSPFHNGTLYNTDERFRCLDFQIVKQNNCRIIINDSKSAAPRNFIGSLFTNAAHNIGYFDEIKISGTV